jgi:hypothetical protein
MAVDARCQGITKQGLPCRAWATRSGFCPIHAPELAGIVEEARRRGGYNRANSRRLQRLLAETGLGQVFEATMGVLARLERGELTPQEVVAAAQLLRLTLEVVVAAHKLAAKADGAAPLALPPVTASSDEERWARITARAAQICEETQASGARLELSGEEERQARLVAEAAKIFEETMPPQLRRTAEAPPALPTEEPHAPVVGARVVMHGRSPYGEETM